MFLHYLSQRENSVSHRLSSHKTTLTLSNYYIGVYSELLCIGIGSTFCIATRRKVIR